MRSWCFRPLHLARRMSRVTASAAVLGVLIPAAGSIRCGSSSTGNCEDLCRAPAATGDIPWNDCLSQTRTNGVEEGDFTCAFTCQSDADCHPNYFSGCTGQADDGTLICTRMPYPDCGDACPSAGMIWANSCQTLDGEAKCVFACRSDADCPEEHYQGCTGRSEDGSMYCEP